MNQMEDYKILSEIFLPIIIFLISILSLKLLIKISKKFNLVVVPNSERWSNRIVAQNGGVSFIIIYLLSFIIYYKNLPNYNLIFIIIFSFLFGLYDDYKHLNPGYKLFFQCIISTILIFFIIINKQINFNIWLVFFIIIGLFFSIFISNAINIIDNVDGLSSGIVLVISSSFYY